MPDLGHRKSCKPCRQRHLRCDRGTPKCSNCRKPSPPLKCFYEPKELRFRRCLISSLVDNGVTSTVTGSNSSTVNLNQNAGSVASIHETSDHCSDGAATQHSDEELAEEPGLQMTSASVTTPVPSNSNSTVTLSERRNLSQNTPQGETLSLSEPSADLLADRGSDGLRIKTISSRDTLSRVTPPQEPSPESSLAFTLLPPPGVYSITNEIDAYIFGFYLEKAGPWLDIVSPNNYFGVHVPRLMAVEPVLGSACLAYASLVLHLQGQIPAHIKDDLHDRALRHLIPLLTSYREDRGHLQDLGPVHATTVILRMTEQFLELGEDKQHHLHGSSTLFETAYHDWSLLDNSMSSTSFWAYLRGSLRISFLQEKPCAFKLNHLEMWRYASGDLSLTDEARTNLMTYLLAEVCTICWAPRTCSETTMAKLEELGKAIAEWKRCLPISFQPWYFRRKEGDVFPDVRFMAPWHGMFCEPEQQNTSMGATIKG
nr:uncharacterized protein CTRU02_05972 [Colletotrichum truncatum]KAF6793100.1 hypothetical protein CTRU02_05972 [Colletotrichum truncatum]